MTPSNTVISIYPIEKKLINSDEDNNINNDDEDDNYLYEFIATSNRVYFTGKDKVEFYGIKKNEKGEYYVKKIKEINGISCSTEADSICQISDKYLCIGLKSHNFKGQKSGFALIDIYKREKHSIIRDQEISCIYFNPINNLLFASMEVRSTKKYYFASKIYLVNKDEDDNIKLENIYKYKNEQNDVITSIQQINSYMENEEENKIMFVTSSNDSTLEIVQIDKK